MGALDYEAAFTPRLPRRTALNRLNRLRDAGWIERHGETRTTVYHLTDAGRAKLETDQAPQPTVTDSHAAAHLSTAAEVQRKKLRRPAAERPAVGYQRSFLDSYQPNETHYLPESVRRKLFEIGSQTGMEAETAGTYELNDIRILQEVFIQAYERSAQRYTVIRGAVGDPDPFRVKYRQAISEQVAEIIRARCDRREAVARLRRWSQESVIENDHKRFVAAAEQTLAGIHEGNFARYRVRPSEFEAWKALWSQTGNYTTWQSTQACTSQK